MELENESASLSTVAIGALAAILLCSPSNGHANDKETFAMSCFPLPPHWGEIGPSPANEGCLLPADSAETGPLPDGFKSTNGYTGTAVIREFDAKKARQRIEITLRGVTPGQVITAWYSYYLPPAGPPAGFPFDDARVSGPLAPITAGFNGGLTLAPNDFVDHGDGRYTLDVVLDYDLFGLGGPLVNKTSFTQQWANSGGLQSVDLPGEYPPFIEPHEFAGRVPVDGGYLREYDQTTGFMVLDEHGNQVLRESGAPVQFIAIVTHTDRTTHGYLPGMPTLPLPGLPWDAGDHFLVGMIDFRCKLGMVTEGCERTVAQQ